MSWLSESVSLIRKPVRSVSREPPQKGDARKLQTETELKNKVHLGWAEREPTRLQKIVTTAHPNHLVQAHSGMDDSFVQGNVLAHTSSVLALRERLADPKTSRADEREAASHPNPINCSLGGKRWAS